MWPSPGIYRLKDMSRPLGLAVQDAECHRKSMEAVVRDF